MRRLAELLRSHSGASAAEYAMILAIVGAAIAVAIIGLGNSIADSMNASSNQIADCGGAC